MKIELRPLQESDTKLVYGLYKRLPKDENGAHNDASGLSEAEFAEWVKRRVRNAKGLDLPEGRVPSTLLILWVDGMPVGRCSLRHSLTPHLEQHGGHIGYHIAKEFRGKGYANIILAETLKHAKKIGLTKVLMTSAEDNVPSWKTIERNNGVLAKTEKDPHDGRLTRYYWITL